MSRNSNPIRADLKNIVDAFRVSELVTICAVAGVSRNGKKTELLGRIYNLIRDPVPSHVERKILDLNKIVSNAALGMPSRLTSVVETNTKNQNAMSGASYPTNHHQNNNNNNSKPHHLTRSSSYNSQQQQQQSYSSSIYGNINSLQSKQQQSNQHQYVKQQSGSGTGALIRDPIQAAANSAVQHPDVKFKVIPFYDMLDVIFKPLCLTAHNGNSAYQDAYFQFTLTSNQLDQISKSPKVDTVASAGSGPNEKTHQIQTQMRFCLMETSCEQLDNYPPYINVRVNSKSVELPPVLPQSKAGQPPKRSPKPLNITKYIRFDNTVNHVQIQWTTEFARTWVCAVFLVKENDSSLLLQRLKQKGARSADHTRALIKDKLKIDPDSEIAMTTLRISLKCPLGVCRMTLPVRSKQCSHVQCFDATFYVKMNEKRPAWQCPVCAKDAPFADLFLDGYFLDVLESSTYETTEIYCYDNGSWEPIDGDKKTFQTIQNTPGSPVETVSVVNGLKKNGAGLSIADSGELKVEDNAAEDRTRRTGAAQVSNNQNSDNKVNRFTLSDDKEKSHSPNHSLVVPAAIVSDNDETSNHKTATPGKVAPEAGDGSTEEETVPPEVIDLSSDSDDEPPPLRISDTAAAPVIIPAPPKPENNQTSSTNATAANNSTYDHSRNQGHKTLTEASYPHQSQTTATRFPSPPLLTALSSDNSKQNHSNQIDNNRKRSYLQRTDDNSNFDNDDIPLAKAYPSASSSLSHNSRAFLNPARVTTNSSTVVPPTNPPVPGLINPSNGTVVNPLIQNQSHAKHNSYLNNFNSVPLNAPNSSSIYPRSDSDQFHSNALNNQYSMTQNSYSPSSFQSISSSAVAATSVSQSSQQPPPPMQRYRIPPPPSKPNPHSHTVPSSVSAATTLFPPPPTGAMIRNECFPPPPTRSHARERLTQERDSRQQHASYSGKTFNIIDIE